MNINGYKSPIDMITEDFTTKIAREVGEDFDNKLYLAIKHVVNVDKDELIKALAYDRDQYNKGYLDGYNVGYDKGVHDERDSMLHSLKVYMDTLESEDK